MVERIKDILNSNSIDGWKLKLEQINGAQGYFIQDWLEMMRAKDYLDINLTVYKDFTEGETKFRGSMNIELFPTMTDKEIDQKIKLATKGALSVKNKWYPLAKKSDNLSNLKFPECQFDKKSLFDWVTTIGEDIFSHKSPDIMFNATEIFVSKIDRTFINSEGVQYSWIDYSGLIEFVTTSRRSTGEEIELFDLLKFSDYSKDWLNNKINTQIKSTIDRAASILLPGLTDIPVIIRKTAVREFFSYFQQKAAARSIFEGMSSYKRGKVLQNGVEIPLTISLLPWIKGSPSNSIVDKDGTISREINIIESGKVTHIMSDLQFGTYLGEEITGQSRNIRVAPGSMKQSDYEKSPYLEAVEFSDFNMNGVTGDFGGEIRLGYYFDGTKKIAVTGGSITGKVSRVIDSLSLSEKTVTDGDYQGPDFICLKGINIAGS